MKITKEQLKQLIKEEISKIAEVHGGALPVTVLDDDEFSEHVSARLDHANSFLDSFQYMLPMTPEEEEALSAVYREIFEQLKYELEP